MLIEIIVRRCMCSYNLLGLVCLTAILVGNDECCDPEVNLLWPGRDARVRFELQSRKLNYLMQKFLLLQNYQEYHKIDERSLLFFMVFMEPLTCVLGHMAPRASALGNWVITLGTSERA